jgi:hypothetical protein
MYGTSSARPFRGTIERLKMLAASIAAVLHVGDLRRHHPPLAFLEVTAVEARPRRACGALGMLIINRRG